MNKNFNTDFDLSNDRVWLNCAHQGVLPKIAVEQAYEAVEWKIRPYKLINSELFTEVPERLKQVLGKLIGALPDDIILGNSASYGIHLIANNFPWKAGDEVLLIKGDFPSCILPWLMLEKKGVKIRLIEPSNNVLQADDIVSNATDYSRLLCTTWVHSFSGYTIDIKSIGEACSARGIVFVLNTSQGLGTRTFDVSNGFVDAISNVGFKWLCGPYGTGFCWVKPELLKSFDCNKAYWLSMLSADDLSKENLDLVIPKNIKAKAYDIFGTANFFNFKPWTASIEYLLKQGIEQIKAHNFGLVRRLIQNLDQDKYEILSPIDEPEQSTLVFVSHRQKELNKKLYENLISNEIYCAFRKGSIRVSPHLYNTTECIDRTLEVLDSF